MDPSAYPHIFSELVDYISDQTTLYALRATCRALQAIVDKLFTRKVVIYGNEDGLTLHIMHGLGWGLKKRVYVPGCNPLSASRSMASLLGRIVQADLVDFYREHEPFNDTHADDWDHTQERERDKMDALHDVADRFSALQTIRLRADGWAFGPFALPPALHAHTLIAMLNLGWDADGVCTALVPAVAIPTSAERVVFTVGCNQIVDQCLNYCDVAKRYPDTVREVVIHFDCPIVGDELDDFMTEDDFLLDDEIEDWEEERPPVDGMKIITFILDRIKCNNRTQYYITGLDTFAAEDEDKCIIMPPKEELHARIVDCLTQGVGGETKDFIKDNVKFYTATEYEALVGREQFLLETQ